MYNGSCLGFQGFFHSSYSLTVCRGSYWCFQEGFHDSTAKTAMYCQPEIERYKNTPVKTELIISVAFGNGQDWRTEGFQITKLTHTFIYIDHFIATVSCIPDLLQQFDASV